MFVYDVGVFSGSFLKAYVAVVAQPIFTQIYPHCYGAKVPNPHSDCSAELVDSQTYTQVLPMQPFRLTMQDP